MPPRDVAVFSLHDGTSVKLRVAASALFALAGAGDMTIYPTLSEYEIQMPRALNAASIVLRVTNAGDVAHNLVIEGHGVAARFETNLRPGDNRDLRVELRRGTYTVYCPIADHRARGMALTLTVGP